MRSFDHIIVGTGQASGTLLGKLIPTGDSIAVIEGSDVGGSCVNVGCTPTKALVASARGIHQARRGEEFGFSAGQVKVDFPRVMQRMNAIRGASQQGLTGWIEGTDNVTLVRGWGRFTGPRTLQVGEEQMEGEKIYINTGTSPFAPPIDGLDQVNWLDSGRLLDIDELPEHLVIIGGGYIGLEFAQIFRRFGSQVTVLQRADQLMPREDADVAEAIQEILEGEGITVVTGARVSRVESVDSGVRTEDTHAQGGVQVFSHDESWSGSHLLVATGRRPNSGELGLENTCIETDDRGFIVVDEHCRTGEAGVFALGDVNGHGAFTHTSVNDAEIVLDFLFGGPRTLSDRETIYALFTDPPLGRVGMTEKEALDAGHKVLMATRPMSRISRAKEMSETQGFAKLIVDGDTDMILGAAILGPSGDEVVNMFAAIMQSGIPCRHYRQTVLVHPTVSELMPWILDGIEQVRRTG